MEKLIEFAKILGIELRKESMGQHTTFKIGGVAFWMHITDLNHLKKLIPFLNFHNIRHRIIGNGSNLLISDSKLDMVFLNLADDESGIALISDNILFAPAGISLKKLCQVALEYELGGLEFASGIPGTLGGAIYMNASAYSSQMSNVLESISFLDTTGEEFEIAAETAQFGYRKSIFMNRHFYITGAKLRLTPRNKTEIEQKMNLLQKKRAEKQPLNSPSAGSVFKRPEGYFAGALIEECGLKGSKVRDAKISDLHTGFIVNLGHASYEDVKQLIGKIQKVVYNQKGIKLETEIEFIE
ncbi:MAG: UDP-N-acetylmuramate dehydrogenase [Oscillospiraceae bacterium]|jgi:UDP-N-acetylmuramate dehydrogenase|nr:UDP-N-acetylmuramate dehydrogenase [Oscillospiraceae bacterium]